MTLTRSILLNFLELAGVLSINPADAAEKVEHLQTLFYNVHDLINQYRPHQARESLVLMMEEQVERFRGEIASVKEGKTKVEELLKTVQRTGAQVQGQDRPKPAAQRNGDITVTDPPARKKNDLQRAQWVALHEELG